MSSITYEQFCGRSQYSVAPVEVTHVCTWPSAQDNITKTSVGYNDLYVDITIETVDFQDLDDGAFDYHTEVKIDVCDFRNPDITWTIYATDVWRCAQIRKLQRAIDHIEGEMPDYIKIDLVKDILRHVNLPITRRGQCKDIYKLD